jgi:hypothetical protein
MKTHRGSEGTAPRILNHDSRWGWVISFTPRSLYPRKESLCYPLDRRPGGAQSRSGRGGEEKTSLPLLGIEPRLRRCADYLNIYRRENQKSRIRDTTSIRIQKKYRNNNATPFSTHFTPI